MIDVKKELMDNIDPKYMEFNSRIIPGANNMLGVRMPVIRRIAKDVCKDDWREFLKMPAESHEERILKGLVISNANMGMEERMEFIRAFVPEIDNWAVCDLFCSDLKMKAESDRKELWDYCLELIDTDDEFKMRVSIIIMLGNFIDDSHIDDVLELLATKYHKGYYYKMGAAWTLSGCYVKYPERTESALFSDTLDVEIRNKAIQKISDSYRVSKEDKDRLKEKKKSR